MRNISKKTRKKLIEVIEANCHSVTNFGEQDATLVPYDSSPLSAISGKSSCFTAFRLSFSY